ncbi:Predicted hydrolases or acyltransferases (alpha/beta hydrolase superfamily) [Ectocarpus siliculosus]|uniref:Predicted hydrolases or acyltransferases (Alpha/beta hydrolase superfamily) n=1 Tax=Ectocarpus siliculosus TaxID=2880 RepID=D8LHX5_ECTSI|nr:Predicted hydrolases or acyltransferases (alpha/beta hydrolase superfamily) [Ectocarpus siliculosus]|eukprot:CBN74406.1 Predicted hydrolases or acyltransferases (alpha/beta hydrolase superfamily) [Ectocarpus siliculosus]
MGTTRVHSLLLLGSLLTPFEALLTSTGGFPRTSIRSTWASSCPPRTWAASPEDVGSKSWQQQQRQCEASTRAEAIDSVWRSALTAGGGAAVGARALLASPQPASGEAIAAGAVEGGEAAATPRVSSAMEGLERIPWREEGYLSWEYDGHKINYVDEGDKSKPALVLIHGFGASVYHWRYNIPALVKQGYRVLALDLLGFGLSDKPIIEYSAETWRDQVCAFVTEVVGADAVVAGNSLGGFTALAAASHAPNSIKGCVMLNGAGRFRDREQEALLEVQKNAPPRPPFLLAWDEAIKYVGTFVQRAITRASFYYTKQPARIKQVLTQVYPDPRNVDDELVESIRVPSLDPNAPEVFQRVISRTGGPGLTVDELLEGFTSPLLLLWGELDPWIRPAAADKIQGLYPEATRFSVQAGHCPHDEAPEVVNDALVSWLKTIGYKA